MMGLTGLSINLLLLFYIHAFLGIRVYRPEFSTIWRSLKANILLFFSNLASHISINGGLIILSFFSVAETLGMYSLAERIVMVLRMFPAMIIQAIYPNAAKLYASDEKAFFRFLRNVYFRVVLFGIFIAGMTYLTAPWTIRILSRTDLQESVTYLQILALVPLLACLNIANVTMMLVADLKNLLFKASWMMCLYMIIVATILTYLMGGVGICLAIISTEIAVFIICMVLLYRNNRKLFHGFYT